jgi:hypothetical protein
MSATTPEGLSPYDSSTVSDTVESFVESQAQLAESLEAPQSAVSDFRESGKELAQLVEEIAHESAQARESARKAEARANDLEQEIADLEEEVADQADRQARETANNRKRISALEDREAEDSDDNPHTSGVENTAPEPETSLEQVCALDDKTASRQLTSNQQRARFVAKNPTDYFSKVPAGYTLTSGEIGKVLRAGTDCDGHTATVDRVIGFLNKFGESDVEVVKRRGTRRVVFSKDLVERLTQLSSHGGDPRARETV